MSGRDWTIVIPDRMELARRMTAIMRVSERQPEDLQRFALDRGLPFSTEDWRELASGQRARIPLMSLSMFANFWQVPEAYFVALRDEGLAVKTLKAVQKQVIRDRRAFDKIMSDVMDLPPTSPPRIFRIARRLIQPVLRSKRATL